MFYKIFQNIDSKRQQESMNGYETDKEDDVVARMKAMLQPSQIQRRNLL